MKTRNMPKLILAVVLLIAASCSKTEEDVPLTKDPVVINSKNMVRVASLINQEIPFSVFDEEGEKIEDAKFFVDGKEWTEGVFKSDKEGAFKLKAVYKDKDGNDVESEQDFRVVIPARNVVVDDFTGAWCKNCPQASLMVKEAKKKTKNIVPIAIHVPSSSGLTDKMVYSKYDDLGKALKVNVSQAPILLINRTKKWTVNFLNKVDYSPILNLAGKPVNIGLGIYAFLDGNNLKVQATLAYGNDEFKDGDKLVVYLVEDKIKHDQQNGFNKKSGHPLEGKGDPIKGYVNDEVLRMSLTGVAGNVIKSSTPLVEIKKNFEATLTLGDTPGPKYENYNKDNLVVVAMVVDKDNNAKQAQYLHVKADGESYVYYDGVKSEDKK